MDNPSSSVLASLQQMFPDMPDDVLQAALYAHKNSVESAVSSLLEMCSGKPEHCASPLTNTTGGAVDGGGRIESQIYVPNGKEREALSKTTSASSDKGPRIFDHSGIQRAPPPPPRTTWSQLRTSQLQKHVPHPQQALHQMNKPEATAPKFIAPSSAAAAARLDVSDFPALIPQSCIIGDNEGLRPSTDSGYIRHTAAAVGVGAAVAVAPPQAEKNPPASARSSKSVTLSRRGGARRAIGTPNDSLSCTSISYSDHSCGGDVGDGGGCGWVHSRGYAAAARHVPPQPPPSPPVRTVSGWPTLAAGVEEDLYGTCGPGAAASTGEEGWQTAAVDDLCRTYPWAARELVEAVCLTLKYELTEVVDALDELNAASYQFEGSGASSSQTAVPSDEDYSDEQLESTGADADADADAAAAAVAPYDFSVQNGRPGRRAAAASIDDDDRGGGGDSGARHSDVKVTVASDGSGGGGGGDVYSRHRKSALKLTYEWRKQMSKASAAFAAGDRALGRRLVSEAQAVRRQAVEAHQAAAARIVEEMNVGRQLSEWELDLHGLHTTEAVEVLATRIVALESSASPLLSRGLAATTAAPAGPSTAGGSSSSSSSSSGGGSSKSQTQQQQRWQPACDTEAVTAASHKVPLMETTAAATATATAKLLASRRVLRVIVGKGLHSSRGEASLPRAVEGFLLERGYRFTSLPGIIEVQMRRHFAAAAAGTIHPSATTLTNATSKTANNVSTTATASTPTTAGYRSRLQRRR